MPVTSSADELQEVARELYSVLPGAFVKERTGWVKRARAEGNRDLGKEIERLRKPTTAAWLLNSLVRHRGGEVQQVLTLGAEMRQAQSSMDANQLRALSSQRRRLLEAVGRQAKALAVELGGRVSDQVAHEVERSLQAAMADPAAAEALAGGLLTDSFMTTGLNAVDLQGLVAVPGADPLIQMSLPAPPQQQQEKPADESRLLAAQQRLEEAEAAAHEVAERALHARRATADAQARVDELAEERSKLEDQLQRLEAEIRTGEVAHKAAVGEQEKADRDESRARRSLERAGAEVERLR